MAQYKVRLISEDGEVHEEDDLYDTEEDAYEYGCYLKSCYFQGQEDPAYVQPRRQPRARLRRRNKNRSG